MNIADGFVKKMMDKHPEDAVATCRIAADVLQLVLDRFGEERPAILTTALAMSLIVLSRENTMVAEGKIDENFIIASSLEFARHMIQSVPLVANEGYKS